jgi:hypothetical protein
VIIPYKTTTGTAANNARAPMIHHLSSGISPSRLYAWKRRDPRTDITISIWNILAATSTPQSLIVTAEYPPEKFVDMELNGPRRYTMNRIEWINKNNIEQRFIQNTGVLWRCEKVA